MQLRDLSPRRIETCTFLTGAAGAIDIRFLMVLLVALKDTKIRHHDCRCRIVAKRAFAVSGLALGPQR
ncbi:MAG: hypothetical protein AB7O44_14325 [Hyphomicrobiaceae bacterium]